MMRKAILAILVLGLFSCAAEQAPEAHFSAGDEGGTLSLDLATIEAPLDMNKVKSFRIRVYPGTPMDAGEETLFDSMSSYGCFPAKGTEIIIENIKEGEDRFVYYEGFSDSQCTTPEVIGIRGGLDVAKTSELEETAAQVVCAEDVECHGVHPRATCDCAHEVDEDGKKQTLCKADSTGTCTVTPPTFVMLLQVGRFNEYPVAGDELQGAAKSESCDSDADCTAIHMNAVCDEEVGRCLIRGLNPLAPATARAFHSATVLDSGKVLVAGGFTHRKANGEFFADGPFLEVFDPYSGLFEAAPDGAQFAGNRVAMHEAVHLGGDRVALVGGVTQAAMEVLVDAERELGITVPFKLDDCNDEDCTNISRNVTLVDLAGEGDIASNPTDMRLLFHQAANMIHGGGNKLLITGGLAVDPEMTTVEVFDRYLLCTLGGGTGATCAVSSTDETLVTPRVGHADLCLVQDGNGPGCQEYMLFGGAVTNDGESGEVFSSSEEVFNAALNFPDPTKTDLIGVLLSKMVSVMAGDGAVPDMFSFGGTKTVSNPETLEDMFRVRIYPPVTGPAPEQVRVDLQSGNLTVAQVDLSDLGGDNSKTFRIFHTSTVMDDDSVLVAGGLDSENQASKNVMFFEDPNTDTLTYTGETTMRQRRFGHTATVITDGILEGAVLIIGGFQVDSDSGLVDFAPPAEIYLPVQ